jgi:hypothetical protein
MLSSKRISLICAVINACFATQALMHASWGFALLCGCLAGYCYSNYRRAE